MGKAIKSVLIVDDDTVWHGLFRRYFSKYSDRGESPYGFRVDTASSASDAVTKIVEMTAAGPPPDVVVVDLRMESAEAGMLVTFVVSLLSNAQTMQPVVVVFTGYPTYSTCVQAMRNGAWDYIVKEDVGGVPAPQIVIDSIVARLRQLDLRAELEEQVSRWLLEHGPGLHRDYAGLMVALWHKPELRVVASGSNPFELQRNLEAWRAQHAPYEEPYLMRLPAAEEARSEA